MTKKEFWENVNTWGELWRTCADIWIRDRDPMEDIILADHMDERIFDDIHECDYSWREIKEYLDETYNEVEGSGYEAYRYDGWLDYSGLTDEDFEELKDEVFELILDQNGFDDSEEEYEESAPCVKEEAFEGTEFDIGELMEEFRDNYDSIQDVSRSAIKTI